ncbi:hypothetical protein [Aeromonas jandaei]|uniref:hypothetical protein n=1 Tax=Aeromonas jandaei TaxID=650 RepID=UPI003B9FA8B4
MKKIIYIDDQANSRALFSQLLMGFLGSECKVVTPQLEKTKDKMLYELFHNTEYLNAASYIIDERLCMTGEAEYQGNQLAESIRIIDEKIPVYILTSYSKDVDSLAGSIEFVIDKNDLSDLENGKKIAQRILRHMNIYNDIRSERALRFDSLLAKSLNETLTQEEVAEFDSLNVLRTRATLMDETQPSTETEASEIIKISLLDEIKAELEQLKRS